MPDTADPLCSKCKGSGYLLDSNSEGCAIRSKPPGFRLIEACSCGIYEDDLMAAATVFIQPARVQCEHGGWHVGGVKMKVVA